MGWSDDENATNSNGFGDGADEGEGGGGDRRGGYRGRGGRGGGRGRGGGGGYKRRDDDDNEGGGGFCGDDDFGDGGSRGRGGGRGRGGRGRGGGGRSDRGGEKGENEDGDGGEESEFNDEKPKEFYIPPEPSNDEDTIFGNGISMGINYQKYTKVPVTITGDNLPKSIQTFAEANFSEYLLENIGKSGYTQPTPIQKAAIPIVLAKRDLMGCSQTGSGKTAAFLLPIIQDLLQDNRSMTVGKPQVLIVSPTRELAIQIYNEARKFSLGSFLKLCLLYGGTSTRHQSTLLGHGSHIIVSTPGRLLDFLDKGYMTFDEVRYVVLDEADRMLDMGFKPAIERIMGHETMVATAERQTLLFSATFPTEIQAMACTFLNPNYVFVSVGLVGGACSDVNQTIVELTKFTKRDKLMEILNSDDPAGTIVFVETRRQADFLASFLSESEHPTTSIHGERLQRQREEALMDFKSGKMKVLIATSVAARGLDIKNVRHVINYDMPKEIDEYVHRIGRTGRLGNEGKATSFYDPDQDNKMADSLVKVLTETSSEVPEFLKNGGFGGGGGGGHSNGGTDFRGGQSAVVEEEEADW